MSSSLFFLSYCTCLERKIRSLAGFDQIWRGEKQKKPDSYESGFSDMAVREGFEPSIRFRIHTFQACSFGHSDTSPSFDPGQWLLPQDAA